jgi:hypothetical protein
VLQNGTQMKIAAITTSNVTKVTLSLGNFSRDLSSTGQGFWQAVIPFDATGLSPGQTNLQFTLSAAKPDGTNATVQIPVTYSP